MSIYGNQWRFNESSKVNTFQSKTMGFLNEFGIEDFDVSIELESVLYNEYNNYKQLLESSFDYDPILEAKVEVLSEVTFQDIKNKIHEMWEKLKKFVKDIISKIFSRKNASKKKFDSALNKAEDAAKKADKAGIDESAIFMEAENALYTVDIYTLISKVEGRTKTYNQPDTLYTSFTDLNDQILKKISDIEDANNRYDSLELKAYYIDLLEEKSFDSIDRCMMYIKGLEFKNDTIHENSLLEVVRTIKACNLKIEKIGSTLSKIEKVMQQYIENIDKRIMKVTEKKNSGEMDSSTVSASIKVYTKFASYIKAALNVDAKLQSDVIKIYDNYTDHLNKVTEYINNQLN